MPTAPPVAAGSGQPTGQMTAEEAIGALKAKIDRLGPVNMMAIEQFDELEGRHVFLTTQRKDLVDSIAQTTEAITRIDETSKVRFNEAFTAIQQNFQTTFSVLFGGGRAGLSLSTRTIHSRAVSTSWRRRPGSGCRASSSFRAARRR